MTDTISQTADRLLDGMLCGVAFDAGMRGAVETARALACFARHEPLRQWHGRTRRGRGVSRRALRKARERDGMAVRGALHMEAAKAWRDVREQASASYEATIFGSSYEEVMADGTRRSIDPRRVTHERDGSLVVAK